MSEAATATIDATQLNATTYGYSVTLTDTGTTAIGTFWLSWVPGEDFQSTAPISVSDPTGWSDATTHFGAADGYAIQWVAGAGASLQPGESLTFSFSSADTPQTMFGDSPFYPTSAALTSFIYSGRPFSDPGVELQVTPACFRIGTRILTASGEVPVEALRPGDLVVSAFGGCAPVAWLGRRRVDCSRHPRPQDVWPVRVRADAFGPGLPSRDLMLSPDHAVFSGAVLIPVRYLVNGASVVQEEADSVVYFHVELPAHDVILAEGMPTESFLDTGNRGAFENGGSCVSLHADFALQVWEAEACAPLVVGGPVLAAARAGMLAQATALGFTLSEDPDLHATAAGVSCPLQRDGQRWCFQLPSGARELRLRSRVFVPAQVMPESPDGRRLGVGVAGIALDGRSLSLDDVRLKSGWHAAEPELRWTDSDAVVAVAGAQTVTVTLAATGRYWLHGATSAGDARHDAKPVCFDVLPGPRLVEASTH